MEAKSNKEYLEQIRQTRVLGCASFGKICQQEIAELAFRLEAAEKQIAEKEAEIWWLCKIAAHVPGSVYIKAKEDAGYGEAVRVKEEQGEK